MANNTVTTVEIIIDKIKDPVTGVIKTTTSKMTTITTIDPITGDATVTVINENDGIPLAEPVTSTTVGSDGSVTTKVEVPPPVVVSTIDPTKGTVVITTDPSTGGSTTVLNIPTHATYTPYNEATVVFGTKNNDMLFGDAYFGSGTPDPQNDTMYGFEGDDMLYGGISSDYLVGGIGHDSLFGADFSDILYGNQGKDYLSGGAGGDYLSGGDGHDTLLGGSDHDVLFGDANDDYLSGDAGNDRVFGGTGKDALYGAEGNDTLSGNEDNDYLAGSVGDDSLEGGAGNDLLTAGTGNDVLYGSAGNDTLSGGAGADTFRFLSASDGIDVITDFRSKQDKIDLHDIIVYKINGNPDFTFEDVNKFTHPGQVRFDVKTHTVQVNTDADPAAELSIQLSGVQALQVDDFIF